MYKIGAECLALKNSTWQKAVILDITQAGGFLEFVIKYENGEEDTVPGAAIRTLEDKEESTNEDKVSKEAHTPDTFKIASGSKLLEPLSWVNEIEETRPDNSKLFPVVAALLAVQYDKEGTYGSSWVGKGEHRGIMPNIDRKYDRLDTMTANEIEGKIKTLRQLEDEFVSMGDGDREIATAESKIDAVADLANYCLLYMTYIRDNYPKMYNAWFENNVPKYLRDKFESK